MSLLAAASLQVAPSDPCLLAVTPLCSTLTDYISPGLCDQQRPAQVLVVILRLGHKGTWLPFWWLSFLLSRITHSGEASCHELPTKRPIWQGTDTSSHSTWRTEAWEGTLQAWLRRDKAAALTSSLWMTSWEPLDQPSCFWLPDPQKMGEIMFAVLSH